MEYLKMPKGETRVVCDKTYGIVQSCNNSNLIIHRQLNKMEVSELAMQQIGEHQVIYIHDNTVILADGDEEVQYVIPSEMGEEEGVLVQEDDAEHYLMSTRQIEQLQDNDQAEIHHETENVEHAGEMESDEHQVFSSTNDQNEVITEVVLNDDQCRMLQGCGRVFLQQGSQRFLLDKDGLREVDFVFNDESEMENVEYILPTESNDTVDDAGDLTEEDHEELSECQNDTQEENEKNQNILQQLDFHQESFEEDIVNEEELNRAAILSHIKLERVDMKVPKEKQVYSRAITSTRTKISSSVMANAMDRKIIQGTCEKRIIGKRRQHANMNQIIERQQVFPRYISQKGKKRQKIVQNSASITSEDIVNLLKANKLDRNGLEQVRRNGKMYIGDTPDGRRIYGRVIEAVKQSTRSPEQDENPKDSLLSCEPTLFETPDTTTHLQNTDKPHKGRETTSTKPNAKLDMCEYVKPNKLQKETNHFDIMKSVQLNNKKTMIERAHLMQSKSVDLNELLQSDLKLQSLLNGDIQTEDNIEDSDDLENELTSVKKVLTTLVKMRSLKELLITRDLMIIREVNQQTPKNSYRKELYFPGRMVSMDDDDQSQDNYQFIHMPDLKGAFPEDGYSPINVDKCSLPCDDNFLIIKFIVSTDGVQPTTRIIVMEKKAKADQHNQELSTNNIDWRPVEMDESIADVKAPSLMKNRQWKQAVDNRPLECRFCKKTFGRASNLARHMSIHASNSSGNVQNRKMSATVVSDSAMFVCDKCPCAYHFQSTLTRHMISAHRDEVEIV